MDQNALFKASEQYLKDLRKQRDSLMLRDSLILNDHAVFHSLLEWLSGHYYDGDISYRIIDDLASKMKSNECVDINLFFEKAYKLMKSPKFKNDIDGLLNEYSKKERAYILSCLGLAAALVISLGLIVGVGFLLGPLMFVLAPVTIIFAGFVDIGISNQKAMDKKYIVRNLMSNDFFKSPPKEQDIDDTAKEQTVLNAKG